MLLFSIREPHMSLFSVTGYVLYIYLWSICCLTVWWYRIFNINTENLSTSCKPSCQISLRIIRGNYYEVSLKINLWRHYSAVICQKCHSFSSNCSHLIRMVYSVLVVVNNYHVVCCQWLFKGIANICIIYANIPDHVVIFMIIMKQCDKSTYHLEVCF